MEAPSGPGALVLGWERERRGEKFRRAVRYTMKKVNRVTSKYYLQHHLQLAALPRMQALARSSKSRREKET
jgi:hypothetical protein